MASKPSYQGPALVRIFGLRLAALSACHTGPVRNPRFTYSRSGLALLSWAICVDTSTAPGVTADVCTTFTDGAVVLRASVRPLSSSVLVGVLSVSTPIVLMLGLAAIHFA